MKIAGFLVAFICVTISFGNTQVPITIDKVDQHIPATQPIDDSIKMEIAKTKILDKIMYKNIDRNANGKQESERKYLELKDKKTVVIIKKVPVLITEAEKATDGIEYLPLEIPNIIIIHDTVIEKRKGIFGRKIYVNKSKTNKN